MVLTQFWDATEGFGMDLLPLLRLVDSPWPGGSRLVRLELSAPLKPTKVLFCTVILYNLEHSIRDKRAILPSIVLSQQCC